VPVGRHRKGSSQRYIKSGVGKERAGSQKGFLVTGMLSQSSLPAKDALTRHRVRQISEPTVLIWQHHILWRMTTARKTPPNYFDIRLTWVLPATTLERAQAIFTRQSMLAAARFQCRIAPNNENGDLHSQSRSNCQEWQFELAIGFHRQAASPMDRSLSYMILSVSMPGLGRQPLATLLASAWHPGPLRIQLASLPLLS
jgi:hypothetical protein